MFREHQIDVLVTCRALDEGVDIPGATVGIVAAATSSRRQRIRRLGRVLRRAESKPFADVYTLYGLDTERKQLELECEALAGVAEDSPDPGATMISVVFEHEHLRKIGVPEKQYESILSQHASQLFPTWTWIPWSPLLHARHSAVGVRPDALMLSNVDASWTVVEVELAHHSISGHIEPQLQRIRHAFYEPELASTLSSRGRSTVSDFEQRIATSKPSFLCIADRFSQDIADVCRQFDFHLPWRRPCVHRPLTDRACC